MQGHFFYILDFFFVPLFVDILLHFPALRRHSHHTGKPDSLSNCSILNQTFDMFQVACSEGFDGGLPQEFVAEVYMMGHKNLFAYVNSKWVSPAEKRHFCTPQVSGMGISHLINFIPQNAILRVKGTRARNGLRCACDGRQQKRQIGPGDASRTHSEKSWETDWCEAYNYDGVALALSFFCDVNFFSFSFPFRFSSPSLLGLDIQLFSHSRISRPPSLQPSSKLNHF